VDTTSTEGSPLVEHDSDEVVNTTGAEGGLPLEHNNDQAVKTPNTDYSRLVVLLCPGFSRDKDGI